MYDNIKVRQSSVSSSGDHPPRHPLKRLEHAIHRIIEVSIPSHLDILSKHRENIEKYQKLKNWDQLHTEQINASRTVQQLQADIAELEGVRNRVILEDLDQFDRRVQKVQCQTLARIQSFTDIHKQVVEPVTLSLASSVKAEVESLEDSTEPAPVVPFEEDERLLSNLSAGLPQDQLQIDTFKESDLPKHVAAAKSWRNLKQDLFDLNSMIKSFSQLVFHQGEHVNSIEDNVNRSEKNTSAGLKSLKYAVKFQKALLPVTGALLGVALGGPVGLVIGVKTGVVCALGGSILGFTGGRALQRKSDPAVEVELKTMSESPSENEGKSKSS